MPPFAVLIHPRRGGGAGIHAALWPERKDRALPGPIGKILARGEARQPTLRPRAVIVQVIRPFPFKDNGLACADFIALARPGAMTQDPAVVHRIKAVFWPWSPVFVWLG